MRGTLAILALFWLSSAACAQSGNYPSAATLSGGGHRHAVAAAAVGAQRQIFKNANECAPFEARAVWSADETLLGYSCYHNPN